MGTGGVDGVGNFLAGKFHEHKRLLGASQPDRKRE